MGGAGLAACPAFLKEKSKRFPDHYEEEQISLLTEDAFKKDSSFSLE